MSFDRLDVHSLLHVLAYVNARGLARVACGGRIGAIMAHEAQQRPALLVLRGTPREVARALPERLAVRPTVAFLLYGDASSRDGCRDVSGEMLDFVRRRLPPETEVLGARSESLQCVWNPGPQSRNVLQVCEGEDNIGLLLATLPEATAQAFYVKPAELCQARSKVDLPEEGGSESELSSSEEYSDDGDEESAMVDAPSDAVAGEPGATTKRAAMDELLALDPPPQVIVIHMAMHAPRGTVERIQAAFPEAAVIGGVATGQQALARGKSTPAGSAGRGLGVLAISGNAPVFAMTSPYEGSRSRAQANLVAQLERAKQRANSDERDLLGALLFTCNGRGRSCFGREANDAHSFHEAFPDAPLLGYYAGGEIGPRISRDQEGCFLRGNARLQGFTAVYGFFLVPRKHTPSLLFQRALLYGEIQAVFREILEGRGSGAESSGAGEASE